MLEQRSDTVIYQYLYSYNAPLSTVDAYTMSKFGQIAKLAARYFLGIDILGQQLGVAHADELILVTKMLVDSG